MRGFFVLIFRVEARFFLFCNISKQKIFFNIKAGPAYSFLAKSSARLFFQKVSPPPIMKWSFPKFVISTLLKRKKTRKHRWWVHNVLQNRKAHGAFYHLVEESNSSDVGDVGICILSASSRLTHSPESLHGAIRGLCVRRRRTRRK